MHDPGPVLVVSLDFELRWGSRDLRPTATDHKRMMDARTAVVRLLELLRAHGVHASWATVGFLFFNGREELLAALPQTLPAYVDPRLSPYAELGGLGPSEDADPTHFAPSLVKRIVQTPGHELACHTFSHYYCLEPGQGPEAFRADIAAACCAARRFGVELRSLVLPRNQVNPAYLPLLPPLGIICYRGTLDHWLYRPAPKAGESLLKRGARLSDAYLPLMGQTGFPASTIGDRPPVNIRASRFLRPFSPRLAALEGLKHRRILGEMTLAARRGLIYHLWWHPHNTGWHLGRNLAFIEALLRHYSRLARQYGMRSMAMAELASEMLGNYAV